ncbi:longitudinals lacking protein, isoforms F/I/K/T-like isoform X2 [Anoplophora glabripennis]|uniref:longitudinals lacking protein, isoforms F/I/K/T-like isoform X2 n=1 Tax=Anoplophora glabripennis TaxID=217634 RepID=UPI0008736F63|nr:longitudinals lacking protein, isoforms F/I/K/T-like isoform X2 [Anoplophora glabripennis]
MADMGSKYDFCGMKKVRKSNFSPEEIEALISTVGKNYHVLYGEFAKRAVNKQARHRVWLDVTKQVNRVSLERRTLQEVKNKWKKCQHLYKERESSEDIVLPNVWEPLTSLKDSMPLEQRLKAPQEQEPILQSQPLSPTKLKVTRQSTKPPQPSPKPRTPEPPNEEVCLRWNSHHSNMQSSFPSLLMREQYVDATLVAEGQCLKCHRLILSSCSPYFEEVLSGISPFQHPVLFMKDIPFWVLKSLCDFMYAGEVHIFQNKLEELLAVAETLKIKGLAGKMDGSNEDVKTADSAKTLKEEKKEEKEVKEKKRNSQQVEPSPKTSSKALRSAHPSKKSEKISKEPLNKEGILDPLDLLEPVYEEVTKESAPPKVKEVKNIPFKKGKLKKRKFSEEREESPPPLFLSRKGTRSRPNVKIPKYYHTHYERVSESTIVREPHTQQPDPLFQLEEIKSEPLDMEDDVIEIEDNVISFSEVSEMPSHDEEIIGNYDSPLVNLNDKAKEDGPSPFKKISLVAQPVIMNIHSIAEKTSSTVKIVDVAQLKGTVESLDKNDPLEAISDDKAAEDPLDFVSDNSQKGTDGITITNVQSMADIEETEEKSHDKTVEDEEKEPQIENVEEEKALDEPNCEIDVESVANETETLSTAEKSDDRTLNIVENDTAELAKSDDEKETENIPISEILQDNVVTTDGESAKESSNATTTNEENEVTRTEPEEEQIVNNSEADSEENSVEPGFHIAKVAREQFSLTEEGTNDVKEVISEDCASELGFQITNVVSGQIEDSDQNSTPNDVNSGELGTFSNHLEEFEAEVPEQKEVKSTTPVSGDSLSEETRFLAESLEKLLDK